MFVFENLPAYIISNEHQRWATQAVPNVKSVLTVAGSGDQALFYKLSGAQVVDTFDININASIIQDIKCTAIKNLNRDEYIDLLTRIYRADGDHVIIIPQICRLWEFFSSKTRETLLNNRFGMMFSAGHDIFAYQENIPTDDEYKKLGKLLDKKFNFIWTDLAKLGTKLQRKYDLINISNIFDYYQNGSDQIKILKELSEYLNINGHIVCLPQRFNYPLDIKYFREISIQKNIPNLMYEKMLTDGRFTKMFLFQKVK